MQQRPRPNSNSRTAQTAPWRIEIILLQQRNPITLRPGSEMETMKAEGSRRRRSRNDHNPATNLPEKAPQAKRRTLVNEKKTHFRYLGGERQRKKVPQVPDKQQNIWTKATYQKTRDSACVKWECAPKGKHSRNAIKLKVRLQQEPRSEKKWVEEYQKFAGWQLRTDYTQSRITTQLKQKARVGLPTRDNRTNCTKVTENNRINTLPQGTLHVRRESKTK